MQADEKCAVRKREGESEKPLKSILAIDILAGSVACVIDMYACVYCANATSERREDDKVQMRSSSSSLNSKSSKSRVKIATDVGGLSSCARGQRNENSRSTALLTG